MKCIGAIDQGTTSTRFILFTEDGNEVARAQEEHDQILPQPGWVEHDPVQIIDRTHTVMETALKKANLPVQSIAALGITNQRETTVVWNRRTGVPLYNAIVWQDMRTDQMVLDLEKNDLSSWIREKTGLPPSTYFSAPKLQWILKNVPEAANMARRGEAIFGTIDTWLIWNLTGGTRNGIHATDVSNASRTMLMNLHTLQWDDELLGTFGIPKEMLPAIGPSSDPVRYGFVSPQNQTFANVPISGNLGDQQAALIGQACFHSGETKNTYGTGNFLLMNTGNSPKFSQHGLLTTCAYQFGENHPSFALEGSVAVTGSAVQWLRDQMKMIRTAQDIETLARTVPDNGGVYFVPAFSGLFAPYWRSDARGAIVGLSRHSNAGHLARATLEAICYQTRDVLDAMRSDSSVQVSELKVDGGATSNGMLMQLQSDILGIPVIRPTITETTALGAAYAAGLAVGFWKNISDLQKKWKAEKSWRPEWSAERRERGHAGWKKAVQRTLDWMDS